jgi:uncharacterized protein (TIRG00374 family)
MKKTLVTLIQAIITGAILWWLFRDPERNREMWAALTSADPFWLMLALGAFGLVQTFAVVRWQILLRVQDVKISWPRAAALVSIGLFFNIFMPGGTGGDVVKIFYLLKETADKKAAALLAVCMDRILGLMGLIAIAGVAISLRYDWLTQTAATSGLLFTLLAIFGGAVGFLVVSYLITAFGWINKLPARLPMRDKLVEISVAYNLYGRAWRSSLVAFLFSMPVHFFSFAIFYCVTKAFSEVAQKASLLDFLAIVPIVNTIAAIPISIGGTGVREGLFVNLLGDLCGISVSMATLISLTGYLVLVLWGVVGGVVYLFYRPTHRSSLVATEKAEEAS